LEVLCYSIVQQITSEIFDIACLLFQVLLASIINALYRVIFVWNAIISAQFIICAFVEDGALFSLQIKVNVASI